MDKLNHQFPDFNNQYLFSLDFTGVESVLFYMFFYMQININFNSNVSGENFKEIQIYPIFWNDI